MAFAQLTFRESLRDIEACLRAVPEKLYHLRLPGGVARNTLAVANEKRDWHIYAEFAHNVIAEGRRLYTEDDLGLELDQTVYALDSTTIDLCLSLFPWARVGRERGSIKVHTLLDLHGNIPANLWITTASFADNRLLDLLLPEPGSIYIMDRGYLDFARPAYLDRARSVFVVRALAGVQHYPLNRLGSSVAGLPGLELPRGDERRPNQEPGKKERGLRGLHSSCHRTTRAGTGRPA